MEPKHEESDECWCLPYTETVERDDGTIGFVIIHNRITDEPTNQAKES